MIAKLVAVVSGVAVVGLGAAYYAYSPADYIPGSCGAHVAKADAGCCYTGAECCELALPCGETQACGETECCEAAAASCESKAAGTSCAAK